MKSNIKLLLTTIIIILFSISKSQADSTYYLDFKYVLNQSEAGKKAQSFLKSRLDKGFKNINFPGERKNYLYKKNLKRDIALPSKILQEIKKLDAF